MRRLVWICLGVSLAFSAQAMPILRDQALFHPQSAAHGMVVSSEPLAAQAALEVLKNGGNAVDAAVTLGFCLAVTLPRAGNLGGGGFMLLFDAKNTQVRALDYREKAPALAHRDMFIDAEGHPDSQLSRDSHRAAGVPGTVAGLILALEQYGSISLQQALAPAIQFAEQGFPVSPALSRDLQRAAERLQKHPASRAVFFKADGSFYQPGEILRQPDLASTLKLLAKQGRSAFYQGKIAELIVAEMHQHDGLISKDDLNAYQAQWRDPISGHYRGYQIYSMSPPSSGGVHIVQMLNMLEGHKLNALGHNSAASIHLLAETMKRAYADRAEYLGDTDFVDVPLKALTNKAYAQQLAAQIKPQQASDASQIKPGKLQAFEESPQTTHFSIMDAEGNAVSNTYTLNFSFGSGLMVSGAGFLLNNEMDDFSAKPGVANAYGLIGGEANAIAPHKRMLSSMSPTLVLKNGKVFLVTGSPGGSRIITTVLQIIINVIDYGMNIQEATNASRIHHQWLPDTLWLENGISIDTQKLLSDWGHQLSPQRAMGGTQSILQDPETGIRYGAADPRKPDAVAVGY